MGGCCSKKDDKKKKGDDEEGDKACIIGPNIMKLITLITLLVSDFDIIFTSARFGHCRPRRMRVWRPPRHRAPRTASSAWIPPFYYFNRGPRTSRRSRPPCTHAAAR